MAVQALLESFANRNIELDLSSPEGVDLLTAAVTYSAVQGGEDVSVTSYSEETVESEVVEWRAELKLNSQCGALEGMTFTYCGDFDSVRIKLKMLNGINTQTGMEFNDEVRERLKERSGGLIAQDNN